MRDLATLPKAHLHLHFTGSMRLETLIELASSARTRLPSNFLDGDPLRVPADRRGWFRFQRAYDTARAGAYRGGHAPHRPGGRPG